MIHKRSNSQFNFFRIRYFFIEGAKRLSARIQNTPNKIEFHTVLDEYRSKIEVLNKEYEQIENTKYTDNDQNTLAECKTQSDTEKAKKKFCFLVHRGADGVIVEHVANKFVDMANRNKEDTALIKASINLYICVKRALIDHLGLW